jgi:4-amino-4-deoxy-L-arabinose transferase-like glycosyltransferase
MSQHALIDGVFAFWATLSLWLLWENLQRPHRLPWLISYGASLAVMVMTKENAMFAYIGLLGVLAANYWYEFGKVTRSLLGMTILGPMAGLAGLIFLCGGVDTFYNVYSLLVSKASVLPYAIATGDGPWYRYLIDLLAISPLVFLLALGAVFRLKRDNRAAVFLILFVTGSYLVMCNVRYGMNLRYANMWDMPLRYLATLSVGTLAAAVGWRRQWVYAGLVALLCAFDLRQYEIFFVKYDLYELVTGGLLSALQILK